MGTWHVQDAPYLLEPLAEGFAEEAVPVKLALLAAVTKLFFRRPPECQKLLGNVLAAASSDTNQDVHDRALLYYRCSPMLLAPSPSTPTIARRYHLAVTMGIWGWVTIVSGTLQHPRMEDGQRAHGWSCGAGCCSTA